MAGPFHNVLIVKLKHLGDVLTSTPLIPAIRQAWPGARISFLVNPGAEDLVRFHPDVNEVFTFPRKGGLLARLGLIRTLRQRRFDLAIELSGGDRGAFLAWIAGAETRVGYRPPHLGWRRLALTHQVAASAGSMHTVEYHLETLRILGLEPGRQMMELHWPEAAENRVRKLLTEGGIDSDRPYAAVHPSSRWMFKTWRADGNAAVVDYLMLEKNLPVVVTSAPVDKETDFVREVLKAAKTKPLDLSGRLSLPELAALIAGAKIFFGVDSLPMHMAAAVSTPAVALFGPSGDHMWGPWGRGHKVVAKDWDCRPCGRDGCDGSKVSRCLVEIETDEVTEALDAVLEGR